jgi:hypothetical protein
MVERGPDWNTLVSIVVTLNPECHSAFNFDPQPWLGKLLNRKGNPAGSWGHGWTPIKFTRQR